MKRLYFAWPLCGLLAIGCTSTKSSTQPDPSKNLAAVKPAGDKVPAPVARLLPAEQLDPTNAHAQARLLEESLMRENGQMDRTATARRE